MKRGGWWLVVALLLAAWLAYATRWQVATVGSGLLMRTNRYTGATAFYIPKRGWIPDPKRAGIPDTAANDPFGLFKK